MPRILIALALLAALTACAPEIPEGEPASATPAGTLELTEGSVLGGVNFSQPVRILGTEPSWAITADDTDILLERPDFAPRHFTPSRFHIQNGQAELRSTDLSIVVKPETCSDGMSDRTYPLTAVVRIGEEVLKGCAIAKAELDSNRL